MGAVSLGAVPWRDLCPSAASGAFLGGLSSLGPVREQRAMASKMLIAAQRVSAAALLVPAFVHGAVPATLAMVRRMPHHRCRVVDTAVGLVSGVASGASVIAATRSRASLPLAVTPMVYCMTSTQEEVMILRYTQTQAWERTVASLLAFVPFTLSRALAPALSLLLIPQLWAAHGGTRCGPRPIDAADMDAAALHRLARPHGNGAVGPVFFGLAATPRPWTGRGVEEGVALDRVPPNDDEMSSALEGAAESATDVAEPLVDRASLVGIDESEPPPAERVLAREPAGMCAVFRLFGLLHAEEVDSNETVGPLDVDSAVLALKESTCAAPLSHADCARVLHALLGDPPPSSVPQLMPLLCRTAWRDAVRCSFPIDSAYVQGFEAGAGKARLPFWPWWPHDVPQDDAEELACLERYGEQPLWVLVRRARGRGAALEVAGADN